MAPHEAHSIFMSRMVRRFWGGVALLVCIVAAQAVVGASTDMRHDVLAELVNTSGRQRMLVQRADVLLYRIQQTPSAPERRLLAGALATELDRLVRTVETVSSRWSSGNLPARVLRYSEEARRLAAEASTGKPIPPQWLESIDRQADALLAGFEQLTTEITADIGERHQRERKLRLLLSLMEIMAVLLIAVMVFWPLLRRLGREREILEAQVTGRTRALRESEAMKRLILESVDDSVILLDTEGVCRSVNSAAARRLGKAPGEMIGVNLFDLFPPELGKSRMARLREAVENRRPVSFEDVRDGRWYHSRMHPTTDDSGKVVGVTLVARDITERRRAEVRLHQSEARYRTIVETAREGIWMLDAAGRTTFVNQRMADMVGTRRKRMIGRSLGDFLDDKSAEPQVWCHLTEGGSEPGAAQEVKLRRGENDAIWTVIAGSPILDAEGGFAGVVVMVSDITRRKCDEEVIRREKERAENYLRMAGTIIMAVDVDGRVTLVNDKGCEVMGAPREEILGCHWVDSFIAPDQREDVRRYFDDFVQGRVAEPCTCKTEIVTRQGERRTIAWRNVLTRDADGTTTGTLNAGEDITEKLQAELERKAMEYELHQSQKMDALGQLAGGMAHEFNNLLVPMIGLSEMAREQAPEGSRIRDNLNMVVEAGARARDLIRKVLSFSRTDESESGSCDAAAVLFEAMHLLKAVVTPSVRLDVRVPAGPVRVAATEADIYQIVMNLGANARDAMETCREPVLQVRLLSTRLKRPVSIVSGRLMPGRYAVLVFRDNGIGMDTGTASRIFEPFFTTKSVGHGTGLGLSVVHGMMGKCGGGIAVSTCVGAGTTFRLYLPRAEVAERMPPADVAAQRSLSA